ncbi:MAG TPA: L-seryl-tRNA(Sec) selenium transferase [Jatrophihabitans sp.]|nr:L-seryl-tRNA(Sec) selenium transferase [Jatrophihabitans sp.]
MAQPDRRRQVPRMDAVLADPRLAGAISRLGRPAVKELARAVLEEVRAGRLPSEATVPELIARLPSQPTSLRPVLNATGVLLHTNLGRAPLSDAAMAALAVARGYTDVEYDLATGARAGRGRGALAALHRAVPDAGAVLVVNNGAAALLLAVLVLAAGRPVLLSRGELVEIGDGFRLHELIGSAGIRIREVGTTNRTRLADYADALGVDAREPSEPDARAGCVLKVHPSNFRIRGFTAAAGVAELAGLGLPVLVDVGSGLLRPDPVLPDEPDVTSALRAGAAVVTCSGDKRLGGPQAGLLFGEAELIGEIRRHPMYRALRVDKLTLAALEASLIGPRPPVARFLHADPAVLRVRCDTVAAALRPAVAAEVVPADGAVGGGGAPEQPLPGWAIALPAEYADRLRAQQPPVVGRVERGRCLLDLRCVPEPDDELIIRAVLAVAGSTGA